MKRKKRKTAKQILRMIEHKCDQITGVAKGLHGLSEHDRLLEVRIGSHMIQGNVRALRKLLR